MFRRKTASFWRMRRKSRRWFRWPRDTRMRLNWRKSRRKLPSAPNSPVSFKLCYYVDNFARAVLIHVINYWTRSTLQWTELLLGSSLGYVCRNCCPSGKGYHYFAGVRAKMYNSNDSPPVDFRYALRNQHNSEMTPSGDRCLSAVYFIICHPSLFQHGFL